MSENAPTYMATYFRPREVWYSAWIKCDDIKIEYDFGFEYGPPMITRVLKMLGKPDGDFVVQEVGVKAPYALRHYYDSMYKMSEYPLERPLAVSVKLYEALCALQADDQAWTALDCKYALMGRDYVVGDEHHAVISPEGEAAIAAYVAKYITKEKLPEPVREPVVRERNPDAIIGKSIYDTLLVLRETPAKGSGLHGLTKRALLLSQFVAGEDNWNLTKAAHDAIARYETAVAEKAAIDAAKPVKEPVVRISAAQIVAFEVVRKKPVMWLSDVPGRTRNFMVAEGWVIIKDDIPSLTSVGRTVYEAAVRVAES